jgi:FtsH-binding integral membrane protein
MAFALVTAVSIALSVYAATAKSDFTKSAFPYLLAISVVMMGAGLMLMLFPSQIGMSVYAAIGALLFSAYLVFDTQMILGGKNRMQFSLDDYVPAAISLYLDIVSLFIYLLQLFGQRRED